MAALTRSEYGEVMHLPAGQIVKKSSGGMEIYNLSPPITPLPMYSALQCLLAIIFALSIHPESRPPVISTSSVGCIARQCTADKCP